MPRGWGGGRRGRGGRGGQTRRAWIGASRARPEPARDARELVSGREPHRATLAPRARRSRAGRESVSKRRGAARRQTHRERGEGRPRDLLPVLVRALGRGGADDELRRARVGARGAASAQAQRREPDERGARHLIPDDCPVVGSRNARAGTRRSRQTQRSGTSTAPRPIDRLKAPGEIHPGTGEESRSGGTDRESGMRSLVSHF